jgi:hypothetical protein
MRTNGRMTATADMSHPVDLACCNGLGILMRERRRMNRRDDLNSRDLVATIADRSRMVLGGRGVRQVDSVKNGEGQS